MLFCSPRGCSSTPVLLAVLHFLVCCVSILCCAVLCCAVLHVPGQAELGDLVPPALSSVEGVVVPSVLLWSVPWLFGSFASGASRVWRDFDGLWLERGCGVVGGFVLADWWEGDRLWWGTCGVVRVQVGMG